MKTSTCFSIEQVKPCPHCGTPRVGKDYDDDYYIVPGTVRVLGCPEKEILVEWERTSTAEQQVALGEYVRSWKILKTLPPNRLVDRWSHFPTPAGEILREISYGVHDRINKHLPWRNRGRKWAEITFRKSPARNLSVFLFPICIAMRILTA